MGRDTVLSERTGRRVAVVGGGWAGLAAAVRLSQAGVGCTVFEASRTPGGRARRVPWTTVDGRDVALDNGQHILIGAYRRTLALLETLGIDLDAAFERTPLHLVGPNGLSLKASTQKAPWHLVAMLLTARGLGIDERWSIAAFMLRAQKLRWVLPADCTVAELFDAWHQPSLLVHKVWEPLCVAALNTPTAIASAQVFLNVLRDSLGASARDSDLLLPRVDLGGLLPDAAQHYVERADAGSRVETGARIQNLYVEVGGVAVAGGTATAVDDPERFDAVVIAAPPGETARLLAPTALRDARYRPLLETLEGFAWQPIVTVYLLYRDPPTWPARMLALESAPHVDHFGQWAFDRSERLVAATSASTRPAAGTGLVAVVISAEGSHREIDNATLVAAVARQLATQCGMPSQPLDARIITEKRATFACTPALARPDGTTPHPHVVLAGDHVADGDTTTQYPGTLEAAVIAGERAAERLIAVLSHGGAPDDDPVRRATAPVASSANG